MITIKPSEFGSGSGFRWVPRTLLALVIFGCEPGNDVWPFESRLLTEAELGVLEWWLTCEECTDADLQRVLALGEQVVPFAEFTMTDFPPGARQNLNLRYGRIWDELQPTGIPRDEFIEEYLRSYLETLRTRSIILLDSLGGGDSLRWALEKADSLEYGKGNRQYLQAAVFRSRDWVAGVGAPSPDSGRISGSLTVSGAGIGGAQILVRRCSSAPGAYSPPQEGRCLSYESPSVEMSMATDTAGQFLFTGLAEGLWEVAPVDPGATPQSRIVILLGPTDADVADFIGVP